MKSLKIYRSRILMFLAAWTPISQAEKYELWIASYSKNASIKTTEIERFNDFCPRAMLLIRQLGALTTASATDSTTQYPISVYLRLFPSAAADQPIALKDLTSSLTWGEGEEKVVAIIAHDVDQPLLSCRHKGDGLPGTIHTHPLPSPFLLCTGESILSPKGVTPGCNFSLLIITPKDFNIILLLCHILDAQEQAEFNNNGKTFSFEKLTDGSPFKVFYQAAIQEPFGIRNESLFAIASIASPSAKATEALLSLQRLFDKFPPFTETSSNSSNDIPKPPPAPGMPPSARPAIYKSRLSPPPQWREKQVYAKEVLHKYKSDDPDTGDENQVKPSPEFDTWLEIYRQTYPPVQSSPSNPAPRTQTTNLPPPSGTSPPTSHLDLIKKGDFKLRKVSSGETSKRGDAAQKEAKNDPKEERKARKRKYIEDHSPAIETAAKAAGEAAKQRHINFKIQEIKAKRKQQQDSQKAADLDKLRNASVARSNGKNLTWGEIETAIASYIGNNQQAWKNLELCAGDINTFVGSVNVSTFDSAICKTHLEEIQTNLKNLTDSSSIAIFRKKQLESISKALDDLIKKLPSTQAPGQSTEVTEENLLTAEDKATAEQRYKDAYEQSKQLAMAQLDQEAEREISKDMPIGEIFQGISRQQNTTD
jgi:hypothetical protein